MIESLKKLNLSQSANECKWSGAVNFLFVRDHVLFIKRSETMPTHAGQLAFAGGHKSQEEINPVETALRELGEETSIDRKNVTVIGVLDSVRTSGNKLIIPVVLYIDKDPTEVIKKLESNGEWDEAILVPYKYLESKSNWSHGISLRESSRVKIRFCPIPASKTISTNSSTEPTLLWGATAQMIWNFFKICP